MKEAMRAFVLSVFVVGAVLATACTGTGTFTAPRESASSMTTSTIPRPPGPAADVSTELTGGNGVFVGSSQASGDALARAGYVEQEFAASGVATSYRNDGPFSADGRWTFAPDRTAPYRTRILVRRPSQPS